MDLYDIHMEAIKVSKELKSIFENRITDTKIYDVVDVVNHHSFKIGFLAYNYFSVVFQYELDIIDCYIESGKNACISLITENHTYSDTDLSSFIVKIKDELELRIPDKYLKAKGWL